MSLDYQESDPEEIFTKVQQKYKSALHDYWRIAALDFDKQNDLYINDAWNDFQRNKELLPANFSS